jgi:hypothetical protein
LQKELEDFDKKRKDIEKQFGNNGEIRKFNEVSSFSIVGHVLSGIMAHLSSSILSATMAWHLVQNESRFQFSHDFSQSLLSQFETWLRDEDIQFRFRRKKNEGAGWIDSNLFQY